MDRTYVNALVTARSLAIVASGSDFSEDILDGHDEFKNVCAKVHVSLFDEIESVTGFLGCNKRTFLNAAMMDACARAAEIMREEGVYEALRECSIVTKAEVAS